MAFYLVTASPKKNLLTQLAYQLKQKAFLNLKPFGQALTYSLESAKFDEKHNIVLWRKKTFVHRH